MGTIMAPNYANIYIHDYQKRFMKTTAFKNNIILFKRYIDDIIIIYDNINNDIDEFLNIFKNTYGKLNLEITHNTQQIDFLEITVTKKQYQQ